MLPATGTEEDFTQNERKHKGMESDAEWIQLVGTHEREQYACFVCVCCLMTPTSHVGGENMKQHFLKHSFEPSLNLLTLRRLISLP